MNNNNNNITLTKIWQDNELMLLNVVCSSRVATTSSKIYVSDALIDDLIHQIKQFLSGYINEGLWTNESKGDFSTACIEFRFISKDKLGHILIEVYAELDDGGTYSKHNCCFYINTEYGLLMNFCKRLQNFKKCSNYIEINLNDEAQGDSSPC